jgi:glutaminyl-tRNA synthetase
MPTDGRKVRGTIHWVSAKYAVDADCKLYDRLFTMENMGAMEDGKTYDDYLNPNSVENLTGCKLEPSLADAKPGERFQFVRLGYFCKDTKRDGTFLRTVSLKDSYKPQ